MPRELQRFVEKIQSLAGWEILEASCGGGKAFIVAKNGRKKITWKFTV